MLVGVGGDAGTLANKKLQCAIVLFFFSTYKSVTQLRAQALREASGGGGVRMDRVRSGGQLDDHHAKCIPATPPRDSAWRFVA